ncbi:hypothetical protein [Streptomyces canus]|uniref:hypothetical protein n=1 Tax=Streptomyces canus TaxID=58343 RepID=UPI0038651301|nr:hypothetical protein OH824_17660 [Streptomyces canus]
MDLIETVYFGWNPLAHAEGCTNPVWDDAQVLHSEGIRPGVAGDEHHACVNGICSHADTFTRFQMRLLCETCGTVHTISGESMTHVISHTSATGWGQPPTQMGEVWLWPGRRTTPGSQPHQYLVTRQAATVTPDTLYGIITSYFDSEGKTCWLAGAVPDENGAHHVSSLRWRYSSRGLAALEDAAAWIAGVELSTPRSLVVAV